MPELKDVLRRLDGIEGKVDDLGKLIVSLAEQRKDIAHIQKELIDLHHKSEVDLDKRIASLEKIHAGCQVNRIEQSITKLWRYFWFIVSAFIATALGFFYGGKS